MKNDKNTSDWSTRSRTASMISSTYKRNNPKRHLNKSPTNSILSSLKPFRATRLSRAKEGRELCSAICLTSFKMSCSRSIRDTNSSWLSELYCKRTSSSTSKSLSRYKMRKGKRCKRERREFMNLRREKVSSESKKSSVGKNHATNREFRSRWADWAARCYRLRMSARDGERTAKDLAGKTRAWR